jgi:trimethylamine--corrinoid protein Co-methyltransferase
LYGARIFSFEQLLLDCEIYEMLRVVAQGFAIDADTLALEVIDAVGPGSHFLGQKHTRTHMRQVWQPTLFNRTPWEEWERQGRPSALDRAREQARHILSSHQPEPLPCADRLKEIITAYEKM